MEHVASNCGRDRTMCMPLKSELQTIKEECCCIQIIPRELLESQGTWKAGDAAQPLRAPTPFPGFINF